MSLPCSGQLRGLGCKSCQKALKRFETAETLGFVSEDMAWNSHTFALSCRNHDGAMCTHAHVLADAAYTWLYAYVSAG